MRDEIDIAADVTLAEAAAWLTRLQGAARTPATEAGFREWLADPAHARAFARVTETWNIIPGAALAGQQERSSHRRRTAPVLVAACLVVLAVVGGGVGFVLRDPVYTTRPGEQRTLALSDGTRVALNTDSRLVVDYSDGERRVRLDRGEAMFEVAKNPRRPFIVASGAEEVRALGTTFVVRREASKLAVTLIEGHVEISRRAEGAGNPTRVAVLSPGERLIVRDDHAAAVDRPKVETATAWRQGEVMFEDALLADAVAELNRYGGEPITIADPRLGGLRVSGVFKAQNPVEFARAVAELHGLSAREQGAEIVLSR